MYDTFVRNGSLIQGTNGIQVYAVDSDRRLFICNYEICVLIVLR